MLIVARAILSYGCVSESGTIVLPQKLKKKKRPQTLVSKVALGRIHNKWAVTHAVELSACTAVVKVALDCTALTFYCTGSPFNENPIITPVNTAVGSMVVIEVWMLLV
jgi:hypothetical protein